jgi:Leucine-rich repeat (LRR) protein
MTKIYFGINTISNLAQVSNNNLSLKNLNLDINDLNVIRGLSDVGVTRDDLKNISILDLDIKAELLSLSSGTQRYITLTDDLTTVKDNQTSNLWMNSQIAAGSFKYNYIDFSDAEIKTSDISTSRTSSWSSFDNPVTLTSPIFYGSDLEVVKNTTSDKSEIRTTGLNIIDQPIPKRFAAEVATHIITIDIDGTPTQFYAMRGIPLNFFGFFKNANFRIQVSRLTGSPFPTWVIQNQDNNTEYVYENIGANTGIQFSDFTPRERRLDFYYDPNRITRIIMASMNISDFPEISMPLLIEININQNDFRQLPNILQISPNLQILRISGNNMSRSSLSANQQLSNLPTTLLTLDMNGSFSDNNFIDLSYLTNLQTLNHNAFFQTNNSRRMTHTGSTHSVGANIQNYTVRHHSYTQLHKSVAEATDLRTVNIGFNNITTLNENYLGNNQLKFASTVLTSFVSDSNNNHNVVNVSGKSQLIQYVHRRTSTLVGNTSIEGAFSGCESLEIIDFYDCKCTGSITETFKNLPALQTLDIRFTRLTGRLENDTFENTFNLRNLYISGSLFNESQFFQEECFYNTPNLRNLFVYNNRNIRGTLPDFTKNTLLTIVYISDTSISGNLPSFRQNISLRNLTIRNGKTNTTTGLNGPMPAIFNPNVRTINFQNNSIVSSISQPFPELECSSLTSLILSQNSLAGPITNLAKCPQLRELDFSGNTFSSYTSGSIRNNLSLSKIDFSNNQLTRFDVFNILEDLLQSWNLNNRRGGQLILLGNNFTPTDINSNENALNIVNFLRSQGWSVLY